MEVQVDILGTEVALKLVLIWFLLFHAGFHTGCKLFILKVRPMYIRFLNHINFLQKHNMHPIFCSIAKVLATCWLGGVISAQKVLF